MEVLKQLRKRFENVNNSVSRWAVGLMFLFMVAAPIELEAQSGLKISSLSEVTDTAKEGADTILDVSKIHSRSRFGYRTGVRDLFSCNK